MLRRLATPRLALALGTLLVLVFAAAFPLLSLTHQLSLNENLPYVLAIAPFGVVGCITAYRQPANAIGWILLLLATLSIAGTDAGLYATLRYHQGYTGLPLGAVSAAVSPLNWMSVLILLPLPVLLFPDGKLPSRRWRWVFFAYGIATVIWVGGILGMTADALFMRPLDVDSGGALQLVDHPTGPWNFLHFTSSVPTLGYLLFAIAAIVVQIRAFRRARGERRQQIKWLLGGGAVCLAGLMLTLVLTKNNPTGILAYVGNATLCCIAALPIGIGVGILKYRLYEIDRLISRTISYTIVTGLLAAVFLGLVLLTTRALPFSSPVGVAAATLAAAALFNPLRRRVQRVVDRRFNRGRYDAEAIVASFSARLRDAVDPETVHAELLSAVERTIEPAHASVWVRP